MLEQIEGVPAGIDSMRAIGKVSKEDYEAVVVPLIKGAIRDGRRLRILCQLGPEFTGVTPGGAWEDVKVGLRAWRVIDGCAVVSDSGWIREWTRFAAFLLPSPVRVFHNADKDEAIRWLSSLPAGPGITHRTLPELGVVVVEIAEPLRRQDIDALAAAVDTWLDTHDSLNGLVIHARAIPGWENIASLNRHLRFIRDHHRKIRRVALAVDGRLAELGPKIADHFVHSELRTMHYQDLDEAIAWAGAASTTPG